MMGQVSIHEYHEIARACCQALNVCRPKAQLARSRMQLQLFAIDLLQLSNDLLRPIWRVIIYNYDF